MKMHDEKVCISDVGATLGGNVVFATRGAVS